MLLTNVFLSLLVHSLAWSQVSYVWMACVDGCTALATCHCLDRCIVGDYHVNIDCVMTYVRLFVSR